VGMMAFGDGGGYGEVYLVGIEKVCFVTLSGYEG
jgi:hypothetical protein